MSSYNIVCQDNKSTVVCEYTPCANRADSYQSEAALEAEFIKRLQGQGYEYINVTNEAGLIANLRLQVEKVNDYTFTDSEWGDFFVSLYLVQMMEFLKRLAALMMTLYKI